VAHALVRAGVPPGPGTHADAWFPAHESVTGLSGLGAGLAGTLFTMAVGPLLDKYSYTPAFIAAALLPLLATAAVWFLVSAVCAGPYPPASDAGILRTSSHGRTLQRSAHRS
jgi:hypothetical protein